MCGLRGQPRDGPRRLAVDLEIGRRVGDRRAVVDEPRQQRVDDGVGRAEIGGVGLARPESRRRLRPAPPLPSNRSAAHRDDTRRVRVVDARSNIVDDPLANRFESGVVGDERTGFASSLRIDERIDFEAIMLDNHVISSYVGQ